MADVGFDQSPEMMPQSLVWENVSRNVCPSKKPVPHFAGRGFLF
jgi:hypothetical protein